MKLGKCLEGGLNPQKSDSETPSLGGCFKRMEVPGGTHTDVVVAVAVPVVDVEAVLVEVADARDVTGVHLRTYLLVSVWVNEN